MARKSPQPPAGDTAAIGMLGSADDVRNEPTKDDIADYIAWCKDCRRDIVKAFVSCDKSDKKQLQEALEIHSSMLHSLRVIQEELECLIGEMC